MAIEVGTKAPDFTLKSKSTGEVKDVTLSDNYGSKNTVLLFVPLAFTGVCTERSFEYLYKKLHLSVSECSDENATSYNFSKAFSNIERFCDTIGLDSVECLKVAYDVMPPGISIGTAELISSRKPDKEDIKLYQYLTEAGIKIQNILYQPEDIDLLINLFDKANIPINNAWCLFVIGHYSGKISYPENIQPFIKKMEENKINLDWAICAFGKEEIGC